MLELEKNFPAERILVLTPGRQAATILRDQIAIDSAAVTTKARARSLSSFAFELVSKSTPNLKLLSGPAQQQLIQQLVADSTNTSSWGVNPKALGLKAFSQELRDLLQVAVEHQLDAAALKKMQLEFPKLNLFPLIDVLPRYLRELESAEVLDPASLLSRATLEVVPGDYDFVLVDDAQDLSTAGLELLKTLSGTVVLVLFGDPDAAIQGFRAAEPGEFLALAKNKHFLAAPFLETSTQALMKQVSNKLPPAGAGPQRAKLDSAQFDVSAPIFDSSSAEADYLAAWLRRLRLEESISFDQMAVVVRTRTQVEQLSRELAARSVPTRVTGPTVAPSQNPLTRAMLEIAKLALTENNTELFRELLVSSFIGLNPIQLRRLERQLVHQLDESIVTAWEIALETGFEYESPEARVLNRVIELVAKIRGAEIHSAHQILSLIWGFAPKNLAELSRGSSEVAAAANRDLDAVLRLMGAAIRFDQANAMGKGETGAQKNVLRFVLQEIDMQLGEDSLAKGAEYESVLVTTASSLASKRFEVVAIPRLQDGIWPNLKPRNSLLHAASLRSYLAGRTQDPSASLRNELADELRLFYKAIASSSSKLLFSAMKSADEQPSQFFAILRAEFETPGQVDFDLRRHVGKLRARLIRGDQSAAGLLAAFAVAGIPGAHPRHWHSLLEPDSQPLFLDSELVSVNASALQGFETCPLHWFIQNFAIGRAGFQASIGTLIHAALQFAQDPSDIPTYVESNWHTLEFEAQWQADAQRRQAAQMAMLTAEYLRSSPPALAVEQGFELQFGRLTVRGKIDRVERTPEGLKVADLKTGKTKLNAQDSLQLAIYQLAVQDSYQEKSAGAKLISVGTGKLNVLEQASISGELLERVETALNSFERGTSEPFVLANFSEHCSSDASCSMLLAKQVTDA